MHKYYVYNMLLNKFERTKIFLQDIGCKLLRRKSATSGLVTAINR